MTEFLWDEPEHPSNDSWRNHAWWDCTDQKCRWCLKPAERESAALSTNLGWLDEAWRFVESMASGAVFTADDVTDAVGQADSPGAMGALFKQLSAKKIIIFEGYTRTRRITSHGRDLKSWRKA